MGAAVPTTLRTEPEAEGDDDVHNGSYLRLDEDRQGGIPFVLIMPSTD